MESEIIKQRTYAIIDRVGTTRDKVIPLLQAIQQEFNYLPADALNCVYERTDIDRAQLLSVATFYSQFSLKPKGDYIVSVCLGTACYVKGSQDVLNEVKKVLGIEAGETTDDGKFTIQDTRCLGCCGLAPVMTINDKVYGRLVPADVKGILASY